MDKNYLLIIKIYKCYNNFFLFVIVILSFQPLMYLGNQKYNSLKVSILIFLL